MPQAIRFTITSGLLWTLSQTVSHAVLMMHNKAGSCCSDLAKAASPSGLIAEVLVPKPLSVIANVLASIVYGRFKTL